MTLPFDHIVITSDEPWGKMHHTQILFADYLSRDNKVIFVNPPSTWKVTNLLKSSKSQLIPGRPDVLNYWNRFPSFIKILRNVNERQNEKRILSRVKLKKMPKVLIWHFDSYRSLLNGSDFTKACQITRIYHVIDPFYNNPIDKVLRDLADLIIITSPRLLPYYSGNQKKITSLPQILDIGSHRELLNRELPEKFNAADPYVVLLGTFSTDIDYEWLTTLASETSIRLILIGKVIKDKLNINKFEELSNLKRVEYLGEMVPRQFYPVLNHAKAGLIIYSDRRRNNICSPLKALNYLIASKPVISNTDCEIPSLAGNSIFMAKDMSAFRSLLQSIDELRIDKEKTKNYLDSITMEKGITQIMFQLNSQS